MEIILIIIKILSIVIPVLIAVAFFTVAERKIMGAIQRRRGPNVTGFMGLLQALADGLKLFVKETTLPSNSNLIVNILVFLFLPFINILIFNYKSLDFILKLDYFVFLTVSIIFTVLVFQKLSNKTKKINFEKILTQLKKEISDLQIPNKNFFFSFLNFIVFLILMHFNFLRLSLMFLFYSAFLLLKELAYLKEFIEKSK